VEEAEALEMADLDLLESELVTLQMVEMPATKTQLLAFTLEEQELATPPPKERPPTPEVQEGAVDLQPEEALVAALGEEDFVTRWPFLLLHKPVRQMVLEAKDKVQVEEEAEEDTEEVVVVDSTLEEVVVHPTALPALVSLALAQHKTMGLRTSLMSILP